MTPRLEADIAAFVAVAALTGLTWGIGSAVLGKAPSAERLGVGILAVAGAAWLVMLQPLAGVSVVAHPWLIRAAGLVIAVGAVAVAGRRLWPTGFALGPALAAACAALAVSAAAWTVPGDDYPDGSTDILWHEGWIRQVVGGLDAPGSVYAGVPNAYPWLEHALAALILSGGGLGMTVTLIVVEAFMLLTLAVGTWLLACELGLARAAAAWAVVLAVAGGGIGWLEARGPAATLLTTRPNPAGVAGALHPYERGLGAYSGDLVLSPAPTPALGNIPPALPRELGLALVPLAVWTAVRAARRASGRWWAAAGAASGLAFLASPVAGMVAALAIAALAVVTRSRLAPVALVAAAIVAGAWLAPLAWHARDLGGFVNTTLGTPVEPTLVQVLATVAVLAVLGVLGAALVATRRVAVVDRRPLAAVAAALVVPVLLASIAPSVGSLPALTRTLHYLPAAALALAILGGVAAAWLVERAGRLRIACIAAIALAATASAATASAGMVEIRHWRADHPLLRCSAPLTAPTSATIAVFGLAGGPAKEPLALTVFARTGASLLYIPRPRIRYRDSFERIPGQGERLARLRALADGHRPDPVVTRIFAPGRALRAVPGFRRGATCTVTQYRPSGDRVRRYRWFVPADNP
ncbi:MAG TPA: glycosyltransferase family 39 protein [Gaiellales bacterium]